MPNNLVASVPPLPTATPPLRWYRRGVPGLGFLTHLAGAYGRAQRRRPYVTQLASSLAIYLAADVSAQRMGGREYDVKRTGRNLVIGAGSSIPGYHW